MQYSFTQRWNIARKFRYANTVNVWIEHEFRACREFHIHWDDLKLIGGTRKSLCVINSLWCLPMECFQAVIYLRTCALSRYSLMRTRCLRNTWSRKFLRERHCNQKYYFAVARVLQGLGARGDFCGSLRPRWVRRPNNWKRCRWSRIGNVFGSNPKCNHTKCSFWGSFHVHWFCVYYWLARLHRKYATKVVQ